MIVPWLARTIGRPVRWSETRSENMVAMQQGRASVLEFTIGGSCEGDVQAYRLRVVQDAGAYPGIGAILPGFTALMSSGVYAIPKIEADTVSVVTNTTPIGPFRGAGRPEATQAIERAMDLFAAELGLDAVEVAPPQPDPRRRVPVHDGVRRRLRLRRLRAGARPRARAADYAALREEQQRRRERATRARWGSVSACTSRSRTGSSSPSSAPSRSRRTAGRSSARAPSRTGRGTRRPSR